jgi:hypothetical protein
MTCRGGELRVILPDVNSRKGAPMAKIGNVQLKIKRIEAFGVRFRWHDGKDVMDNKEGIKLYPVQ